MRNHPREGTHDRTHARRRPGEGAALSRIRSVVPSASVVVPAVVLLTLALLTLALLTLAFPSPLEAQLIRGLVVEEGTERPIAGATVQAVRDRTVVVEDRTDETGAFELRVPRADRYELRASALGFAAFEGVEVEVERAELVEVTLQLSTDPLVLDELTVEARRTDPLQAATYEGLYLRREVFPAAGSRRALLRSDPEVRNSFDVEDVLRWFPPARGCVDYYLNGQFRDPDFWPVMEMPTADIEGIEFYRDGRDAPRDYWGGRCEGQSASGYSVIAIWYRRAGP